MEHIARTLLRGDYRQAYIDGEEQKENNTKDIYIIIAEGIDYCIGYESYEKGETSEAVLLTYKNRLMSSVYEKRMEAYQSLIKNKQSQTNREIGEELEQ